MRLIEEIKALVESRQGRFSEKDNSYNIEYLVAERKSFLSKKRLLYIAQFSIDQDTRVLEFSERLKETGFGLSVTSDSELTSGFGFKKETYKTDLKQREGTIQEQARLFDKTYNYKFDFNSLRDSIKDLCSNSGYEFKYKIF